MCLRARVRVCLCEFASFSLSSSLSLSHSYCNIYIYYITLSLAVRAVYFCVANIARVSNPFVSSPPSPSWPHSPPRTLPQCHGGASTALDHNSPRARKLHPSRAALADGRGQRNGSNIYSELEKINARTEFSCPNRFFHEPAPTDIII